MMSVRDYLGGAFWKRRGVTTSQEPYTAPEVPTTTAHQHLLQLQQARQLAQQQYHLGAAQQHVYLTAGGAGGGTSGVAGIVPSSQNNESPWAQVNRSDLERVEIQVAAIKDMLQQLLERVNG